MLNFLHRRQRVALGVDAAGLQPGPHRLFEQRHRHRQRRHADDHARQPEQIAADAQARLLAEQESRLAAADDAALSRYMQICAEGAARAETLRASCEDMLPQAADMVVRKVFGE